jgi:hypothetical protein
MTHEQLEEVKKLIQQIVQNLPCPICSGHALHYFKKNPFSSVRTLSDLRYYLCEFHNSVNVRTNKPSITYEEHLLLYQRMDFSVVLQHFLQTYRHLGNTGVTMMLYSFHRQAMLKHVQQYFSTHAYLFIA